WLSNSATYVRLSINCACVYLRYEGASQCIGITSIPSLIVALPSLCYGLLPASLSPAFWTPRPYTRKATKPLQSIRHLALNMACPTARAIWWQKGQDEFGLPPPMQAVSVFS